MTGYLLQATRGDRIVKAQGREPSFLMALAGKHARARGIYQERQNCQVLETWLGGIRIGKLL